MYWHCCTVVALVLILTTFDGVGVVAYIPSSWYYCHCVLTIPLLWSWHTMGVLTHVSASLSSPHCGSRCCSADMVLLLSSSHMSYCIGIDSIAGGDVIVVMHVATCQLDCSMGMCYYCCVCHVL